MMNENDQIDLKISEFQQIQQTYSDIDNREDSIHRKNLWLKESLQCLLTIKALTRSKMEETTDKSDNQSEIPEIKNGIIALVSSLKTSMPKLLLWDRAHEILEYITQYFHVINNMLLYLKTKKELSLPKSSAELLYQTCYVVLNHYLPNIYKTLKPELREGSDVLKTIPAHTKDQEFHKEWNMSREKFYLQFLKFIRYLNELDPGAMISNLSLFLSESFKIEKCIESLVSLIQQCLVMSGNTVMVRPKENNFQQLVSSEGLKYQSFLIMCLMQNHLNEDIFTEAIELLLEIFTSSLTMKRWLTNSSNSGNRISVSSTAQRIQKSFIKVLQICVIKITPENILRDVVVDQTEVCYPVLSLKQYQAVLNFLVKSLRSLSSTPSSNLIPIIQVFPYYPHDNEFKLNEIETSFALLIQLIIFNTFIVTDTSLNLLIAPPSPLKKKNSFKQHIQTSDHHTTSFTQFFNNLSLRAQESIQWLHSLIKLYSNNNYCYHFPFIAKALAQHFPLKYFAQSFRQILLFPKSNNITTHNWIEDIINISCIDSSSQSDTSMQVLSLLLIASLLTLNKNHKHSSKFMAINQFLMKNYFNLIFDISGKNANPLLNYLLNFYYFHSNSLNNEILLGMDSKGSTSLQLQAFMADGYSELFLFLVQCILFYEISSRSMVITNTAAHHQSIYLNNRQSFASSSLFTVLSFMEILLEVFVSHTNHSLRTLAAQTLGEFHTIHWKFIEDYENSKNISPLSPISLRRRIYEKILFLTNDEIGNVRTSIFRTIGEILSSHSNLFLLLEEQSITEKSYSILVSCIKGCEDSKLSVRIQSTFALNKYLIYYPSLTYSSGTRDELYKLYLQLFKDSDKLLTTVLFGIGYLMPFYYQYSLKDKQENPELKLSPSSDLTDNLIKLLYDVILPGFSLNSAAASFKLLNAIHDSLELLHLNDIRNEESYFQSMKKDISLVKLSQKYPNKFICANTQTMTYILWYLFISSYQESTVLCTVSPNEHISKILFIGLNIHLYFFQSGFLQLQMISAKSLSLFLCYDYVSSKNNNEKVQSTISLILSSFRFRLLETLLVLINNRPYFLKLSVKTSLPGNNSNNIRQDEWMTSEEEARSGSGVNILAIRQDIMKSLVLQLFYLLSLKLSLEFSSLSADDMSDYLQLFNNHLENILAFLENVSLLSKNDSSERDFIFSEDFPLIPTNAFFSQKVRFQEAIHQISGTILLFIEACEVSPILKFRFRNLLQISEIDNNQKYDRFDGLESSAASILELSNSTSVHQSLDWTNGETKSPTLIVKAQEDTEDVDEF